MDETAIHAPELQQVRLEENDLTLAYRELGAGPPVLLLHGWPTSSLLWRNVMPPIARRNRVIAPDLPGFGASDKPLGVRYDFAFFEAAIDEFLALLGVADVALGVHDIGGPIGLHWAVGRLERVTRLALLNTLVYPEFSEEVLNFVRVLSTPDERERLTSREGFEAGLPRGLADQSKATPELIDALWQPFATEAARRALADAGIGLEPEGFATLADALPGLRIPVQIVYGGQDHLLPDVAQTMARVKRDMPQARVTALAHCGHFLQEEAPEEVAAILAAFFAEEDQPAA